MTSAQTYRRDALGQPVCKQCGRKLPKRPAKSVCPKCDDERE